MRFSLFLLTADLLLTVVTYLYYRFVFKAARGSLFFFIYVLLSANVVLARILPDVLPLKLLQVEAYLSGLWLGIMYYSLWVAVLHLFVYVGFRCFNVLVSKQLAGSVLLLIFTLIGCWGALSAYQPEVRNEKIFTEKLPEGVKFRIALISDLHLGRLLGRSYAQDVVSLINDQKPDMVIIAGDVVDDRFNAVTLGNSLEPLNNLEAPEGVFVAFGNHDYFDNPNRLRRVLKLQRAKVLLGSSANTLNNMVKVTGLVDFSRDGSMDALRQLALSNEYFYSILVDHQPRRMVAAEQEKYDLYLAGHTHTGQMWPNRLFTSQIFELDYGRKAYGKMVAIVTSGIGFWGPPIRSSTAPEVVIIDVAGRSVQAPK